MSDVSSWDVSAASNNSSPPDGFPENQAPSTVNNAAREVMAAVKRWHDDVGGVVTSGGSSNAYTLAAKQTISSYSAGQWFAFVANHSNTGAATLNVDSVGAKSIKKNHDQALVSGDIKEDQVVVVYYQATDDIFEMVSQSGNTGSDSTNVLSEQSSNYTLQSDDLASLLIVPIDISAGDVVITELALGSMSGAVFYVVTTSGGGNVATADASGGTDLWYMREVGDYYFASYDGTNRRELAGRYTFESSGQTITSGGTLSIAHNGPRTPEYEEVEFLIECTSGEAGYSSGDRSNSRYSGHVMTGTDATNVDITYNDDAGAYTAFNKSTGAGVILTNSSWNLIMRIRMTL